MVSYKKIDSITPVAEYLAEQIANALHAGQRVVWLLSGGSAMAAAVAASKLLAGKDLRLLTVTLTDERYGEPGHPDSNWRQLLDSGLDVAGAAIVPVLDAGESMAVAVEQFDEALKGLLGDETAAYSIGLFGIGPDGHTAGILPHSPALTAPGYAAGYEAADFKRITMTPLAISHLDEAVVYAVGKNKWPVLDGFDQDQPAAEQPAQLLRSVPQLTICSDRKGDIV